jgi:catechol 2,3-dioxygenase-like lactoylglutathione lyase family enzyme
MLRLFAAIGDLPGSLPRNTPNNAEVAMGSTLTGNEPATGINSAAKADMKLEVVVVPVSDVDRAKRFYLGMGWRLDADFADGDRWRVVQLTPPGSACSFFIGTGLTNAKPGSAPGLLLMVDDIDAARAELVGRGMDASEVFHFESGQKVPGPDPERAAYNSFLSFSDPDGNGWMVQEVRRAESPA